MNVVYLGHLAYHYIQRHLATKYCGHTYLIQSIIQYSCIYKLKIDVIHLVYLAYHYNHSHLLTTKYEYFS